MAQTTDDGRPLRTNTNGGETRVRAGFWRRLRGFLRGKGGDATLRDTIEEIIEEIGESEGDDEVTVPIGDDERVMLFNILKLRHLTAYDVMVPRADIVAVDQETGLDELIEIMRGAGHSRVPVYRGTLDDVVGLVHIKDLLTYAQSDKLFTLSSTTRKVLFVAPSMPVLDLLLEMRSTRVHMALVVDEFGGVDGIVTIEDLVEEIVGEIQDEYDVAEGPKLIDRPDGSLVADARVTIEEFEDRVGPVLSEDEREEDIDTLGGFVFALAGRVPSRGELIVHPDTGMTFEVMEADPRRVKRLRVRNLPPIAKATVADG
jgi:CBS domain containing-hemolysin-like protein